jgi:hypothetical protein
LTFWSLLVVGLVVRTMPEQVQQAAVLADIAHQQAHLVVVVLRSLL